MVYISWSKFLKNWFTKPLGPSLGVTKCGPRGMTMRQEVNVLIFFYMLKKGNLKKTQVWLFSCFSWASFVFHLMVDVLKMRLANLLTTILTKTNERFNLNMFKVIYMWLVSCVITTLNRKFSLWLNLMLFLPYLAQHQFSILWKLVLEYLLEDILEVSFYHCFFFHILTDTKLKHVTHITIINI